MKVIFPVLFSVVLGIQCLHAEPSIFPILFFMQNTSDQTLSKRAHTDSDNAVSVTVRFVTPPDMETIMRYEEQGLTFKRHNGQLLHSRHIYPATLRLASLDHFRKAADILRIESTYRPSASPTLNVSNPQVQASRVWNLKVRNAPIDGSGVIIANVDTGIDIYHPAFFKPDAGVYIWLDTNNSGTFEPGIDCVDLNKNGNPDSNERLNFYDAYFSDPLGLMERTDGIYDADIDWLYNDSNGNGVRDYGPDKGFTETDPSFGELIFIISDDNSNNRLDTGEILTALGTSRIMAIIDAEGLHRRGENLFTNTGDYTNHGTGSSGIVGGQVPGRRLTGMAPGVDFICINQPETNLEESVLLAKDLGGDIFMYEFGNWMFEFLDGSSNLETFISDLHLDGFPQITASGNLAGPERKKHVFVTLSEKTTETVNFKVPQGSIKQVFLSILWRGRFITPAITLHLNDTDQLSITGDEKEYVFGDLKVISGKDQSPKDTFRMDMIIYSDNPFSGDMSLDISNPNKFSALDIDAYIADDVTQWMRGAQFQNFITDDGTVCSPGTAEHDITVGAYDPRGTRNEPGAINDFSSWGLTIDGRRAVDITAPGTLVYSLSSHYYYGKEPGGYLDFGGTSSSLPHVVGCAALIKQIIPDISSERLADILLQHALVDDFTGPVPNDVWGYGKLRIFDAVTLSNLVADVEEKGKPSFFLVSDSYPNPFNAAVAFTVAADRSGVCDIIVYNVLGQKIASYRINLPGNSSCHFSWNARGESHRALPSGLYFFSFTFNTTTISKKAVLLR